MVEERQAAVAGLGHKRLIGCIAGRNDMTGSTAQLPISGFKIAVFSCSPYVHDFIEHPLRAAFHGVRFIEHQLDKDTAELAHDCQAINCFVNDEMDAETLKVLSRLGVKIISMRCAGYDRIDLKEAAKLGMRIVRVPAYSPRSVAEHAMALTYTLARNLHLALPRVHSGNYTLNGLIGFELTGKTFGIVGTGKIGVELIRLLQPYRGRILAYDVYHSEEAIALGAEYVTLEELLRHSDVVSLHTPLLPSTRHIIGAWQLELMKSTAVLINVSRGGLVKTSALTQALELGKIAAVAMDVYENESDLFFTDWSELNMTERMKAWDKKFSYLKALPNVIVTPHAAFLTKEALQNIADTTVENLIAAATGGELVNEVKA